MSEFQREGLAMIDGRQYYVVPHVDRMDPFLMHIVSDGDQWMFVSSTGALTAGRVNSSSALFPYETDDRIHAAAGAVGPVTRLRVESQRGDVDWTPFSPSTRVPGLRTLAKSVQSDAVMFRESHDEHGLTFSYRWNSARRHGFIRTATVTNNGAAPVRLEMIDGLLGLLPHGLEPVVYERLSNLSNAYKRAELIDDAARLAVYSLESPVSDSAEPREVLRANVVWSSGFDGAEVMLDPKAVKTFERNEGRQAGRLLTGRPGAYLLRGALELAPGETASWRIVADVAQDQSQVIELRRTLGSEVDRADQLEEAIVVAGSRLAGMMALADARQHTGDSIACAHQIANVTYNVMRGGVPLSGYQINVADFASFVTARNRSVAERHQVWFTGLPTSINRRDLLERIAAVDDVHLTRLGREYLPISFSRRHGDPSRPWNAFSIQVHDADGNPVVYHEGNWRDLFQNWEALCGSFPQYLPGLVSMFVNASTADGHNPYRITRVGIDWEVPDPDDPWANIGYWGDHQLIYLLRLLQASDRFMPGAVAGMLNERSFTYADVPYRISPYDELVRDPKSTITFDEEADTRSRHRVAAVGGDGKLLCGSEGELVVVTLIEKLLVAALAKLANFVPGGGIWMNTQRPEWNDANNALVGYGLSMVTLCHLRQFLDHLRMIVGATPNADVSSEVATWLDQVASILRDTPVDGAGVSPGRPRKEAMDRLGKTASDYRSSLYTHGRSGETVVVASDAIVALCDVAIGHLDATIRQSGRGNGLVHSYNLVEFSVDRTSASVVHLPEMLEGQVAVLGCGVLGPKEQADLLEALFNSALYRSDQHTFMLAPVLDLPSFVAKNVIPSGEIDSNDLLAGLIAAGDSSVVLRDGDGRYRFHPDLICEPALVAELDRLAATDRWRDLVRGNRQATLDTYERVFGHRSFIGRSASMHAYEGIGSVYWHMVGKLLVAIQEAASAAVRSGVDVDVVARLVDSYEHVRAGLGVNKTSIEFGAIPIDPYSHTPAHAGAQQPGMTGAVKEELLVRPLELGVRAEAGRVIFDPLLLRRSELLESGERWTVTTVHGDELDVELEAQTLGLTVCQVPVVIGLTHGGPSVQIEFADGRTTRQDALELSREDSARVFGRTGEITLIRANFPG